MIDTLSDKNSPAHAVKLAMHEYKKADEHATDVWIKEADKLQKEYGKDIDFPAVYLENELLKRPEVKKAGDRFDAAEKRFIQSLKRAVGLGSFDHALSGVPDYEDIYRADDGSVIARRIDGRAATVSAILSQQGFIPYDLTEQIGTATWYKDGKITNEIDGLY